MKNAILIALAFVTLTGAAKAATPFDGNWSILAVTESGTCDRAYRFPVKITNGKVTYAGTASTTATGSVDRGGRVKVNFSHGEQRLVASGAARADAGAGNWTSKSCKGNWTAERR
jgi:hypothetical protein